MVKMLEDAAAFLGSTPARVSELVSGLTDEQLRRRPETGKFSLLENVLHLRDIEVEGFAPRLERILAEDRPRLTDLDGARLARERRYNEQPLAPSLGDFRSARGRALAMLLEADEADLAREAEMEHAGPITLARLLEMWRGHDHEHLAEMEQLRRWVEGS